ncbi:hypothetical protein PEC301653_41300 [Pectobacterium carotovorum subsp. carotovorum]|nr:purine ribonucleoside efflux pump NepI [Pectobacterium carotovorum subsp. carotovorum PCC21]GKW01085.1 hypothetical protein PEC301653_41300 [Pectobacterium carotovorum subsp. carotovorum]
MLGLTLLIAISGAIIALAPNYMIYMAGRALIGIAIGGFWSMSAASAIRLVPTHQVLRALVIFNGRFAFDHSCYQSSFTISGMFLVIDATLALLTSVKVSTQPTEDDSPMRTFPRRIQRRLAKTRTNV